MEQQDFYDSQVERKLRDFIQGNERVENAWRTIRRCSPDRPRAILEVGCGIGQISDRLGRTNPGARVVAVDTNARSIDVARSLFDVPNVEYRCGRLEDITGSEAFDLVVIVDVYEHISCADRRSFHSALRTRLQPGGTVILTFPTPEFLAWLKENRPNEIQPVDEDIGLEDLAAFGHETGTYLSQYFLCSAWRAGDYAHAVFTNRPPALTPLQTGTMRKLTRRVTDVLPVGASGQSTRRQRRRIVDERVGCTSSDC